MVLDHGVVGVPKHIFHGAHDTPVRHFLVLPGDRYMLPSQPIGGDGENLDASDLKMKKTILANLRGGTQRAIGDPVFLGDAKSHKARLRGVISILPF